MILGIDPSLTGCGLVVIDYDKNVLLSKTVGYTIDIRTESEKIKRQLVIAQEAIKIGKSMQIEMVGVEGFAAMPKKGKMGHQISLAELIGVIKSQIFISLKKIPIIVPPPSWKKSVIGNGHAKKPEIKKVLKSLGYELGKQDEYDALGVALHVHNVRSHAINQRKEK